MKNIESAKLKIIDCHGHIFPEEIAPKVICSLEDYYKMPWQCKGTVSDILDRMDEGNIYKSIVFSTSTKPSQVETINNYMAGIDSDRFICFGSVHPKYENYKDEIDRIISLGLKGIKFHPDFQNFKIDDSHMLKIYEYIGSKLPIMIHTGDENSDFSSPKRLARVLDALPDVTFIAAHLGGYMNWQDSMKYLVGRNLYLDTSSTLCKLSHFDAAQIIKAHGTDKVLFGTDYPAVTQKSEVESFMKIPISDADKVKILSENAMNLFGID